MPDLTRRKLLAAGAATAGLALPGLRTLAEPVAPGSSFRPGELWRDTTGKPIYVHGGSIIQAHKNFYWYGENKEHTTGKDKIYSWGVRCYKSADLYNWEDLGTIVAPDLNDVSSPLHPHQSMDRPHILFNKSTGKFVCWLKIMESSGQTRSVLTADSITGPYTLLRKGQRPLGMGAGDYDLVASPDDGKAYMYFERVHSEMICADLTDDYTDFTGYYSTHFPRPGPPLVREGLAYFRRRGKHYLASSGTTGYFPNPSEIAIADTYHGPWTVLGDLHPTDRTRTSFNSQICAVFKHPGKKDLYLAIADRWMGPLSDADFDSGDLSRNVQSAFHKVFSRSGAKLTPEESRAMSMAGSPRINTSQSGHVWLPILFDGEHPRIEWRDEWSLEEFT